MMRSPSPPWSPPPLMWGWTLMYLMFARPGLRSVLITSQASQVRHGVMSVSAMSAMSAIPGDHQGNQGASGASGVIRGTLSGVKVLDTNNMASGPCQSDCHMMVSWCSKYVLMNIKMTCQNMSIKCIPQKQEEVTISWNSNILIVWVCFVLIKILSFPGPVSFKLSNSTQVSWWWGILVLTWWVSNVRC